MESLVANKLVSNFVIFGRLRVFELCEARMIVIGKISVILSLIVTTFTIGVISQITLIITQFFKHMVLVINLSMNYLDSK